MSDIKIKNSKEIVVPATEEKTVLKGIRSVKVVENAIIVHYSVGALINTVFVPNEVQNRVVIIGRAYNELMSDKPSWNNKKEAGLFTFDDLWYVINAIEDGTLISEYM